jgi:hypothetical protein
MVETPLAKKIMAGEMPDGCRVVLTTDEQGIVFEVTSQKQEGETVLESVQSG